MSRKPRRRDESILAGGLGRDILLYGVLIASLCLGVYWWFLHRSNDPAAIDTEVYARTAVFTAVAVSQLVYVLGIRSSRESLLLQGFLSNWRLTVAVLVGLLLQSAVVYLPLLQAVFHTTSIMPADLPLVVTPALVALATVELQKMVRWRSAALF